jgi:hypothetical protein
VQQSVVEFVLVANEKMIFIDEEEKNVLTEIKITV